MQQKLYFCLQSLPTLLLLHADFLHVTCISSLIAYLSDMWLTSDQCVQVASLTIKDNVANVHGAAIFVASGSSSPTMDMVLFQIGKNYETTAAPACPLVFPRVESEDSMKVGQMLLHKLHGKWTDCSNLFRMSGRGSPVYNDFAAIKKFVCAWLKGREGGWCNDFAKKIV